jgi:hypothetical protein
MPGRDLVLRLGPDLALGPAFMRSAVTFTEGRRLIEGRTS